MKLDPVGCGARDVKECLLAQLEANGEGESLAAELVKNHLEDLQPHRLQHLSKETGVELHELNEEINKIRDSRPVSGQALFVGRTDFCFARSLYRKDRRRLRDLFYRRRQPAPAHQLRRINSFSDKNEHDQGNQRFYQGKSALGG